MLREIKPRNARTARIVKAREPRVLEDRKKTLLLHGAKCPQPIHSVLKTIHTLTKPHSILLTKKNENIHPFEDPASLEFLASKNDCGLVVFGTHSKKRPNNVTIVRIYNGITLDMVELLLLPQPDTDISARNKPQFQIGVEMKPLILFAGSQWADTSSSPTQALYSGLKSLFLDLFCGEEIPSVDVAGLQYILMIAARDLPPTSRTDTAQDHPIIQLRWYKIQTRKSGTKLPRIELEPAGPTFDFRVGRFKEAEASAMKDALKKGRGLNEARTKKNIEMDLVGDKIGRVHLGKQDLSELQTRKMKGLKRGRDEFDEEVGEGSDIDMEEGGMEVDGESQSGSEIDELLEEDADIFDDDEEDGDEMENIEAPKRQKLA